MENINNKIMARLAEERRKKLTQEQLAEKIGLSAKSIAAFENGRRNPSFNTFVKICSVLQPDMNYIIYGKRQNGGESNGNDKETG